MKGQHPLEVHRPDTNAHRNGAATQPGDADLLLCSGYASCKIERGVRRGHGNEYRARHLTVVVRPVQLRVCRDHHNDPSPLSLTQSRTAKPRKHRNTMAKSDTPEKRDAGGN